ncbi:hypothetical protein CJU89_2949 [Yarrowia sp. B02]|nr:hypothetical protein CJU89_2949 [Yarrowia sp. B02]
MLDKWKTWEDYATPPEWFAGKEKELHASAAEAVLSKYSPAQLEKSWKWVLEQLKNSEAEDIPDLKMADVAAGKVSQQTIERAKKAGCFVVRGVVEPSEARDLNQSLQTYIADNKDTISGWPVEEPHIKQLYWTEAQVRLRAHKNHLVLQKWLNELWEDGQESEMTTPLTYADALRSMPAGATYPALGPHIDAGSLSRWTDDSYRDFYDAVFSGEPEKLDLYRLKDRSVCKQDAIPGPAHSSVLRTFQGWTCLTDVGEKKGGIWFYPRLDLAITYLLLRPFFTEIKSEEELANDSGLPTPEPEAREDKSRDVESAYLSPSNWKFAKPEYFPGTNSINSQMLGNKAHPHLELQKRLVSIPDLQGGDSVWWHCDGIHAVEPNHTGGPDPAVVVYIASVPTTEKNVEYLSKQAESYKARTYPPDFHQTHPEVHGWDKEWVKGGEEAMLLV